MRVLVLTPYLYGTAPGPRTSIELWERVLGSAGISFEYAAFETERLHEILYSEGRVPRKAAEMLRGLGHRAALMADLDQFDAVLVYREAALIGPAVIERWVARRGKPIIYQLDDPLYVPYRSPYNGYLSYLRFFGKVRSIARMSRVVIVNSPQHVKFARQYNRNVWEIPSVVDESRYSFKPRAVDGGTFRVGWTGSQSTSSNLQVIRDVLRTVARRPGVELEFVGADDFGMPDVPHRARRWRPETEVDDIRRFDIGLLPLPDNPWNRRKFYVKLIQYMALGVPPVATPLGANPFVIADGRTGFLADTQASWTERIDRLLDDSELRMRVGAAAAAEARAKYTLAANAERIVAAFRSAMG